MIIKSELINDIGSLMISHYDNSVHSINIDTNTVTIKQIQYDYLAYLDNLSLITVENDNTLYYNIVESYEQYF